MTVIWAPQAIEDVEAALSYLSERNIRAAEALAANLFALVDRLSAGDLDGQVHVLTNGERVRGWPLPPFRVYYQRTESALVVLRVYHQRRQPIAR